MSGVNPLTSSTKPLQNNFKRLKIMVETKIEVYILILPIYPWPKQPYLEL
jgi:hypothetical protein